MKLSNKIFAIALLSILLGSCSTYYIPNTLNTPLFKEKGDMKASLNVGLSGFNPQIAYAVDENIGIMLNGSFTEENNSNSYSNNFLEAGVGYFDTIPETSHGRFEIYGGAGYGNITIENSRIITQKVNTTRIFIQPAVGISSDIFDGSFATRLVMVNHKQDSISLTNYLFEPAISLGLGYKYLKFTTQFGLSLPMTSIADTEIDYIPFIFSFGINIDIGKMLK